MRKQQAVILVLSVALLAWLCRGYARPTGCDRFDVLHSRWQDIRDEARAVQERSGRRRQADEWGDKMQGLVEELNAAGNERWITSWARDGSWLNYGLSVDGRTLGGRTCSLCPLTTSLLSGIPGVAVAGFSKVLAGGRIESHRDTTGGSNGLYAYHLCLEGSAWLRVGDDWVKQTPGRVITFDPEIEHEVVNHTDEDRTILYMNVTSSAS